MPRSLSEMSSGEFSPTHHHSHSQTQTQSRSTRSGHSSLSSSTGSLVLPLSPSLPHPTADGIVAHPAPSPLLPASLITSISITEVPQPSQSEEPVSYEVPTLSVLTPTQIFDTLVDLAHPYTAVLSLEEGIKADGVSFQPCLSSRSQDRYVVEQLDIPIPGGGKSGKATEIWTLTGVFDGHLGETTVEHVAHHLPIIVLEHLTELALTTGGAASFAAPQTISDMLTRAITAFDASIANDVLALFPGGMDAIEKLSDEEIRAVINDRIVPGLPSGTNGNLVTKVKGKKEEMSNYRKVQLNMYGTTALISLVDPKGENLWVASVGDCQAVLASRKSLGGWDAEMLNAPHNGSNPSEIQRILQEHPAEPECILKGRVLGAIAPFRCLGDQPFKQPPAYTRRILYNLDATPVSTPSAELPTALPSSTASTPAALLREKAQAISPWEQFLTRNHTPPYISAEPEVVHRRLRPIPQHFGLANGNSVRMPNHILVLCTDGLQDLYTEMGVSMADLPKTYVNAIIQPSPTFLLTDTAAKDNTLFAIEDNLALRLLRHALGGDDCEAVSQLLQGEPGEDAWIDDVTVVIHVL